MRPFLLVNDVTSGRPFTRLLTFMVNGVTIG